MPGVVSVQPRVGSLLQQVAQGVSIARDVYGIKHEGDMADIAQQRADREKQAFDERGAATAKDLPYILKNARTVDEGTEGAIQVPVVGAPGQDSHSIYILPKKEQDYRPVQDYVDQQGKHGTAFIDVNNPSEGPVGFVQTAKPQPPQRLPSQPVPLANGNYGAYDPNTKTITDTGVAAGARPGQAGKDDNLADKRFDALSNYLEGGRAAPQDIKDESRKLRTAAHGMSLLNGGDLTKLNEMTPVEMNELGGVLAAQVAQGSPAQATLHEMTPNTAAKSLAQAWTYITGKPQPANQGEIAQLFARMLDRQAQTSQDILADKFNQSIANYQDLADKKPEKWERIVKASGLTLDHEGNVLSYEPGYLKKARSRTTGKEQPQGPSQPGVISQMAGNGAAQAATMAPTPSGYLPGSVIEINGVPHRVNADGKTADPIASGQ